MSAPPVESSNLANLRGTGVRCECAPWVSTDRRQSHKRMTAYPRWTLQSGPSGIGQILPSRKRQQQNDHPTRRLGANRSSPSASPPPRRTSFFHCGMTGRRPLAHSVTPIPTPNDRAARSPSFRPARSRTPPVAAPRWRDPTGCGIRRWGAESHPTLRLLPIACGRRSKMVTQRTQMSANERE